jgi:kynurenine formamidase
VKLFDLSHTISSTMPVYPGTEPPVIETACTLEGDGFLEKKISLYSHIGMLGNYAMGMIAMAHA